ncbi:MAG: bifunctional ornithine acetyltransferase/N-acetylglutamate synthase, partial [Verrucomicrobiota bacterium]
AGMICPNMATMLSFVLTDAAVDTGDLQHALEQIVDRSFNRILVDGDTSTNDTVLVLANGAAGTDTLNMSHPEWPVFAEALEAVCLTLAKKVVRDGEGSTRFVTLRLRGAASDEEADLAIRSVADSIEVRANWQGDHPDWGRIMHALGYSKAKIIEEKVDIFYDEIQATRNGTSAGADPEALAKVVAQEEFALTIDLNQGGGEAVLYSCDATEEYIRINIH